MEQELVMAIVAGVFGFLCLLGFAIRGSLQKSREATELAEKRAARLPATGAKPEFFLTRFRGSQTGVYRAYVTPDSLIFLRVGRWMIFIDPEIARGTDQRSWMAHSSKALAAAIGGIIVAGLFVLVIGIRAVMADVRRNPGGEGDGSVAMSIIIVVSLIAVAAIMIIPLMIRKLVNRGRELDQLDADGLAEEAEHDPLSFRATAENLSDVTIAPPSGLDQEGIEALLSFKHKPTGKWKMDLLTTKDVNDAVRETRRIVGANKITVTVMSDEIMGKRNNV